MLDIIEHDSYFEHDGNRFYMTLDHDGDSDAPWDAEDGHGPVSEWTTRAKRPGERVLCEDGPHKRFYDYAEAIQIARRDAWDAKPYGTGTAGERAERAVNADFNRLKAWCDDEWCYVGVIVSLVDDDGEHVDSVPSGALWGIESDCPEYISGVARELAGEIVAQFDGFKA